MSPSLARRLWDVAFTGIPFGIFKFGGGLAAYEDVHPVAGVLIAAWGIIDITLNLMSVPWPRRFGHCLLSNVGRLLDRRREEAGLEQAFLAIDTLLSFSIVSTMIGFGRIGPLPAPMPWVWMVAVIVSLLGVGVERVWASFRNRRRQPEEPA